MRKKLVAANWKMNGNLSSNAALLRTYRSALASDNNSQALKELDVLVCIPAPYLQQTQLELSDSGILWGGQTCSEHTIGAFTGEIAASMLREFGASHVLIGHSERRYLCHEGDDLIAKKFIQAQRAGLIPVLCVGETSRDNERGEVQAALDRQLDAILSRLPTNRLGECVISYEPLWAIGTGKVALPETVQAVHAYIRAKLSFFDAPAAQNTQILYGGSVKPVNAAALFAQQDVDGALVGGASLIAEDFLEICRLAVV